MWKLGGVCVSGFLVWLYLSFCCCLFTIGSGIDKCVLLVIWMPLGIFFDVFESFEKSLLFVIGGVSFLFLTFRIK